MSPQVVGRDYDELNLVTSERLYPHDKHCFLIVVPEQMNVQDFLHQVFKHGDVQSICLALLIFASLRITIQRAQLGEWVSIIFKTLQMFLVQGHIVNRNAIEAAWTNILRGFSFIAISTTSAILFKSLVNVRSHQIDTVADLINSNLTVFVPESLSSQFDDRNTKYSIYFYLR